MKKLVIAVHLLFLATQIPVVAQGESAASARDTGYSSIPGEAVYLHFNTSLIFAGEILYYKVYCMNTADKQPSKLSKIAYVALIGTGGREVFRHKLRLGNGLGQGDFFVPADVPTGSYKLLAYTQWMKNGGGTPVFEADIILVNPYLNTTEGLDEVPGLDSLGTDSLAEPAAAPPLPVAEPRTYNNMQLTTRLDKAVYGKRELVTLELIPANPSVAAGAYSISVRRIPDLERPAQTHAPLIPVLGKNTSGTAPGSVVLPELRGELISGSIRATTEGRSLGNIPVAVSFVGDEFVFDMARTQADGKFYFNINREYEEESGIFQVVLPDTTIFTIRIDDHSIPDPASAEFYDFAISAEQESAIKRRSIRNQIENAYEEVKADTLVPLQQSTPFYRDFQLQYPLDDFTRFNTIEETLVEIVDHVWINKTAGTAPKFQVRPFDGYLDGIGMAPMVFMDGLFIQNHEDIIGFPARRIKNIFISRDRYQVGANIFQGILAFETFSSDFAETYYRDFLTRKSMFKPQPRKSYYFEQYSGREDKSRIPDFREQLYWNPELKISGEGDTAKWYTSDLEGVYEISIEGYATDGRPVSLTTLFSVE